MGSCNGLRNRIGGAEVVAVANPTPRTRWEVAAECRSSRATALRGLPGVVPGIAECLGDILGTCLVGLRGTEGHEPQHDLS